MELSPRQIESLAGAICGGEGTPIDYRSSERIDRFRAFVGIDVEWTPGSSRWKDTVAFLEACNGDQIGRSELPTNIERVVTALLDRREFSTDQSQDQAIGFIRDILAGQPLAIRHDSYRNIEIVSTRNSAGQDVIEQEIHTVFERVVGEEDLRAARAHYKKARQMLTAGQPDYENAAKEAVCCIESLSATLTGERNLNQAMAKAVRKGLIPLPLAEMVKKLYAYRSDEPGVAHGKQDEPDVDVHDAYFLVNQAAVIGLYVRAKLVANGD